MYDNIFTVPSLQCVGALQKSSDFAEVAELADARDLKSLGPKDRTGSIPVFGTNFLTIRKTNGFLIFEDRSPNRCNEPGMVSLPGSDQDDVFERQREIPVFGTKFLTIRETNGFLIFEGWSQIIDADGERLPLPRTP